MATGTSKSKTKSKFGEYTGKQKAAIFLVLIGPEASAEVFKYLKEEEIEDLTFEIAKLEKIEQSEKIRIMEEFNEMITAQDFLTKGGLDFAREILEKSMGMQKAQELLDKLTTTIKQRPFDAIRRADPEQIVNFIASEHPQTIALILSYLDHDKSAMILSQLPSEMQPDIARRIALMERTSPEMIREVEQVLERKLATIGSEDFAQVGGIQSIVEILNFADRSTEKHIIDQLEDEDPDLAEDIKKRMFLFEDIVLLDDRSVMKVLREVDTQDLAKALKGVDPEVQEKVYRNMSKRAALLLREEMDFMGPIRLRDVEESQQKIVNIIRKLEDSGEIVIARGGEEELVI
jgi:flagellar motor switch protein FliG